MKKYLIFILLVNVLPIKIFAENDVLEWVKKFGGSSSEQAHSTITDAMGNVFTVGYFEGTADFNPGVEIYNLTSEGEDDIFISKLDPKGNLIWAKRFGGSFDDNCNSITIDKFGNLYVTGIFSGTVDFNPDNEIFELTSKGGKDIFISKFDSNGDFIWVKQIGGSSSDYSGEVAVDKSSNVYLTGSFSNKVNFNKDAEVFELSSKGGLDVFICKFDSSGGLIWLKQLGGISSDLGLSTTIDVSNNVYVSGAFTDKVDFDPGLGKYELSSEGESDVFICKLDSIGNFVWAKRQGGPSRISCKKITTDLSGNVYTCGDFINTADFNPGDEVFNLNTYSSGYNGFISKLDSLGNFIWAQKVNGHSNCNSVAIDNLSNVYVTGFFAGTIDFDSGYNRHAKTSIDGSDDVFILKLDSIGNFIWVKQFGGTYNDYSYSIFLDKYRNVYLSGFFGNTIDFDPSTRVDNLTSFGRWDVFVHKMISCEKTISISETVCEGEFKSPSKKYIWNSSGTYTDTISYPSECDSVFVIDLEFVNVDTTVFIDTNFLKSNANEATYQWMTCDLQPIDGETNQEFSPLVDGDYCVAVTQRGCTDTSSCHSIVSLGVQNCTFENSVKLFPNPTTDKVKIQFSDNHKSVKVYVSNQLGKVIYNQDHYDVNVVEIDLNAPSGIYYVMVILNSRNSSVLKLIKN